MAAITVRNLDENVKSKLQIRAASNGRSMEAEARAILEGAVNAQQSKLNVAQALRAAALSVDGVDLEIPPREEAQRNPFEGWTEKDWPGG